MVINVATTNPGMRHHYILPNARLGWPYVVTSSAAVPYGRARRLGEQAFRAIMSVLAVAGGRRTVQQRWTPDLSISGPRATASQCRILPSSSSEPGISGVVLCSMVCGMAGMNICRFRQLCACSADPGLLRLYVAHLVCSIFFRTLVPGRVFSCGMYGYGMPYARTRAPSQTS